MESIDDSDSTHAKDAELTPQRRLKLHGQLYLCWLVHARHHELSGPTVENMRVFSCRPGATNLQMDYNIGLFAEYPEVEIIGFSFNTTVLGWGAG